MDKILDKVYDPHAVEPRLYEHWERSGYFHAEPNPNKKPYTIVIPPPNITGQLHMGHALDETNQDILIRYKRMSGFETLWLPGTDHASIATEVKIVDQMAEEGLTKKDIGREAFLERAWAWRNEYGRRIVNQLKKLGSSCDWERERFTMDEGCSKAVIEVFCDLYEKGLIYRGDRIINWCPDCKTALSDAEVEYAEQQSSLWHIRYPAEDGGEGLIIATTRPETMLGDVAVAVHPDDKRYAHLVGKNVILPVVNKPIPVIADTYVEMDFGTGALKITPSHDPNDFEVALRHDLPMIRVIADDGRINELGGAYCGMERMEAREKIVEELKASGVLIKIEPYAHNVGQCYRCATTVEPLTSTQWFVSMKPLAKRPIEAVKSGEIKFVPERFDKIYFNWMENIRDWCISRQLWWGHRIPAYYCDACGEMTVSREAPKKCPKCGSEKLRQDEDVLDTWFSSGLWPFSTLGWPEKVPEVDYFYPTDVLVTGYDIIFFWVARMVVMGYFEMDQRPFHTVFVHGIVRDAQGRKMSKSLGNGIDPLEVIEKYGADSLRFSLTVGNAPGNDMRFYWEKVEAARNFCNKLWNAARFVTMNLPEEGVPSEIDASALDVSDKWILYRLNATIREVTQNLDEYDLGLAAQKTYDFLWNEYCDWYVEFAKARLYGEDEAAKQTALAVLVKVLRETALLLHPFMPFITEEIFTQLPGGEKTAMYGPWPQENAGYEFDFGADARTMESVMDIVRSVRTIRLEMNVPPSKKASLILVANEATCASLEKAQKYILRLASASDVRFANDKTGIPQNSVSHVAAAAEIFIPLEELVDLEKEKARLAKEREKLENEIARAENKLANEGFINKAPAKVILDEKAKLDGLKQMLEKLGEQLAKLS